MPILELILLLVALAGLGWLALDWWRRRPEDERRRLERLASAEEEPEEEERAGAETRSGFGRGLAAAGVAWAPSTVALLLALIAVVAFTATWLALGRLWLPAAVIAALVVYGLWILLREWGRFRARRFERQLSDAVDHLVSALMAGENPTGALESAAASSPRAVRAELEEVVHRLGLGMSIRRAVARMVARYDSEGVRLFTQTLMVKWQTGGDLAPVLRSVAAIMRERLRLNMRLRTELTGVQVAGVLLALLPYLVLPVFLMIRPDWPATLVEHPLGPRLLVSAIVLQVAGLLWLRRILKIEL